MTKQLSFVPFVLLSSLIIFTLVTLFSASNFAQAKSAKLREADFVDAHCTGEIEYVLADKTRVDCLTDTHAIEYDWGKKWAESLGQALFYSAMTGKKAGIVLYHSI